MIAVSRKRRTGVRYIPRCIPSSRASETVAMSLEFKGAQTMRFAHTLLPKLYLPASRRFSLYRDPLSWSSIILVPARTEHALWRS
jgi:hypothetical protein